MARTLAKFRLTGAYRAVLLEVKTIRTMRLRISGGRPILSVPPGTSPEDCKSFLDVNEEWIVKSLAREQEAPKESELSRELVKSFIEKFPDRLLMWEKRMDLFARRTTFKRMTSRWGSCNYRTRDVSINVMLALFPEECTDYVIVHELAHLVHPNHSPAFWALVAQYIPNWKSLRAQLRTQS